MFELTKAKISCALAAAISVALLTGCAGPSQKTGDTAADRAATAEELYVWRVEQAARRQNVDVVWINPPRSTKPRKADETSEKET